MKLVPEALADYHYWKVRLITERQMSASRSPLLQNPYWGTSLETHDKVRRYYTGGVRNPKPVLGALDGARRLKQMGFKLVIVTARQEDERPATEAWLSDHFQGQTCPREYAYKAE